MKRARKQYRPILAPANPPDSFTIEEAQRIVRKIVEEDWRAVQERLQRFRARREAAARGTAA